MQSAIGDLSWSPWCSTIFATVNVSGDIKFFDLNRARKAPLEPKRYKDTAINHIAFNKNEFVFITGNDRGKVHLWKMAEPLRKKRKKLPKLIRIVYPQQKLLFLLT